MRIFKGLRYGLPISIVLWLLIFVIVSAAASAVTINNGTWFYANNTNTTLNFTAATELDSITWNADWINVTNLLRHVTVKYHDNATQLYPAVRDTYVSFNLNTGYNYDIVAGNLPSPYLVAENPRAQAVCNRLFTAIAFFAVAMIIMAAVAIIALVKLKIDVNYVALGAAIFIVFVVTILAVLVVGNICQM